MLHSRETNMQIRLSYALCVLLGLIGRNSFSVPPERFSRLLSGKSLLFVISDQPVKLGEVLGHVNVKEALAVRVDFPASLG